VGSKTFVESQMNDVAWIPSSTRLLLGCPNPWHHATLISYEIPRTQKVSLKVYDVSGALVKTLCEGVHQPGRYEIAWRGRDEGGTPVSSGIYFYRLETASGFCQTHKMIRIRR
jgi:hypothetical protein